LVRPEAETAAVVTLPAQDIRYARSGSANIAYHVTGAGAFDFLVMSWVISLEDLRATPWIESFIERLASFGRVILYDRRGVGLSDPVSPMDPPTLDQQMDDALAVLDAVRATQQVCVIADNTSSAAVLLAAQHPERVTHLVLDHPRACFVQAEDFPFGMPLDVVEHEIATAEEELRSGRPMGFIRELPSVVNDPRMLDWWFGIVRRGVSPATMRVMLRVLFETDVRAVLPTVHAPALVICRRDTGPRWIESVQVVADLLPNSTLIRPPGVDPLLWIGDLDPIADAIREFTGTGLASERTQRALATVLFTDLVDSTGQAVAFGDQRWRELLDEHDRVVAQALTRFGGRQIKTTGDGVLATFDGPTRAVRCACEIRDAVRSLDVEIRAGLHVGEIELRGNDVAGIAVHIGQRVQASAEPGEVIVSRTVTDLVAGSGLEFDDRGEHELKGVPGRWQLYAVKT
jgi:class 3 adenylate cyclase